MLKGLAAAAEAPAETLLPQNKLCSFVSQHDYPCTSGRAGENGFAGAAASAHGEGKADSSAAGIPAPTRGEAGPVVTEHASASGGGARAEPQPMQVLIQFLFS